MPYFVSLFEYDTAEIYFFYEEAGINESRLELIKYSVTNEPIWFIVEQAVVHTADNYVYVSLNRQEDGDGIYGLFERDSEVGGNVNAPFNVNIYRREDNQTLKINWT